MLAFFGDFKKHKYDTAQLLPEYEEGVRRWIRFLRSTVDCLLERRQHVVFKVSQHFSTSAKNGVQPEPFVAI